MARTLVALSLALALAAAIAAAPHSAAAQAARPEFNLGGGPTLPIGDLASHNPIGYNLTAGIGYTPNGSSLGYRVEGLYDAFSGKNNYVVFCSTGTDCGRQATISGVTFNLTYAGLLPRHGGRSRAASMLYAIGGFGFYTVRQPGTPVVTPGGTTGLQVQNQAQTGWNAGGGIRFPLAGVSAYVEARIYTMSQMGSRFLPLSVGLIF